jgi:hypothetical protein
LLVSGLPSGSIFSKYCFMYCPRYFKVNKTGLVNDLQARKHFLPPRL